MRVMRRFCSCQTSKVEHEEFGWAQLDGTFNPDVFQLECSPAVSSELEVLAEEPARRWITSGQTHPGNRSDVR